MRQISVFVLIIVLFDLALPSYTYRILGLFPYNAVSHSVMCERLMKGLAERGHHVDVMGHFPLKKPFPNYNDIIDLSSDGLVAARQNNLTWEYVKQYSNTKSLAKPIAILAGSDLCQLMSHPKFQKLVKNPPKDPPYDLVITEVFGANCYLAMGQHLKVPVVGIVTSAMWAWANDIVANPDELAYIPHVFSGFDGKMSLWHRIQNTLEVLYEKWQFRYHTAEQDNMIKKYIGPHAPNVREAEKNVSLILVNSHYSLNGVRPFTTAVVEVGGLHIPQSVETLESDIQKWLDESEDGFIYISFGSMVKIESFPKTTLFGLYASMAKLAPMRVLMKIAKRDELPPGLPNNVLTHAWIPQLAVLHHRHIRAFMTHGGLMGTQEAVYCGVPMIGVPLFADQSQNIQIYVRKNIAVSLDVNNLTEQNLDAAFNTILRQPSYMQAAKKLSVEFRDRPMPALETAIFWVEYVVRHGGQNLKSPAMDLAWWQTSLLDVYGILILAVVLFTYLLARIVRCLIRAVYKKNTKKVQFNKKHK